MAADSISPIDAELLEGLRDVDPRRVRLAITFGADPNGKDQGDSFFEQIFWERNADNRLAALKFLVALGGKPSEVRNSYGLLYSASLWKKPAEIAFLLGNRINPNGPTDEGECL